MTQTLDLNKMELEPMQKSEILVINGGSTNAVYDLGTFIRFTVQVHINKDYRAGMMTLANWFLQQ